MNKRILGRTGLRVGEIGLGTVELGMDYGVPVGHEHLRPPEEEAAYILNRALELGVNFIDTARAYGESEHRIGRALHARRREFVLATKLAPIDDTGLSDADLRRQVQASVAESLRTLQTDVLDVLQIHLAPLDLIRRGRVTEAMLEAKQAGDVRFIGASTYGEEAALAVLEDDRFDTLQIAYNLADRHLEDKVLPLAQQRGVGIILRSVLLRGVLTHRYTALPEQLAELRQAIAALAALTGPDVGELPEMAYRFVLGHPAVGVALVGTARLAELTAALTYAGRGPLPDRLLSRIREVVVGDRDQLNPGTWPKDLDAWQAQRAA